MHGSAKWLASQIVIEYWSLLCEITTTMMILTGVSYIVPLRTQFDEIAEQERILAVQDNRRF